MQSRKIYFKSDFSVTERSETGYTLPFRFAYYTAAPSRAFVASFDGTEYHNCHLDDDGNLVVGFDDHRMGLGVLMVQRTYYLTSALYASGVCDEEIAPERVVAEEEVEGMTSYYNICLSLEGDKSINAVSTIAPYWSKGPKGDKGEPFTFDDFTPQQLEELKQPAIGAAESAARAATQASTAKLLAEAAAAELKEHQREAERLERERGESESAREIKEEERQTAERAREQAERERQEAEEMRKNAETDRAAEEVLRDSAEYLREAGESQRKAFEAARQEAEAIRQSNEVSRQNSFNSAQSDREIAFNASEEHRTEEFNRSEASRQETFAEAEELRDAIVDEKVADITRLQAATAEMQETKANKVGVADGLVAGLAKGLLPESGVVNTDRWRERHTASSGNFAGGDHSIADGVATLDSLRGVTVKNLLPEVGISTGTIYSVPSSKINLHYEVTDDYVKLYGTNRGGSFDFCTNQNFMPNLILPNHKYLATARVKDSIIFDETNNSYNWGGYFSINGVLKGFGYTINDNWRRVCAINTAPAEVTSYLIGLFYSTLNDGYSESYIDRKYGIRLYDLTEMGIAQLYTGTDAAERYADLFDAYTDGIGGVKVEKLVSEGANMFDKDTMVLRGKGIDTRPVQLAENGNFADGTEHYLFSNATANNSNSAELTFTNSQSYGGVILSNGSAYRVPYTRGHKYYAFTRVKFTGGTVALNGGSSVTIDYKDAPCNEYVFLKGVFTANSDAIRFGISNSAVDATTTIDKSCGLNLIDLTAMGCDTTLPNGMPTTVENCEAYFGQSYIPYNDGSTFGKIIDKPEKKLLVIPALRSEVGDGKNNGYRLHDMEVVRVGWNPYPPTSGCFDKVYGIRLGVEVGDTDYDLNTMDGYLYVEADGGSDMEEVVVHPKWSYTSQFDNEWYAKHKRYWRSEVTVPTHYIDGEGERQEIVELHGLYGHGQWYRDEIDFTKGKYVKRIGKLEITPEIPITAWIVTLSWGSNADVISSGVGILSYSLCQTLGIRSPIIVNVGSFTNYSAYVSLAPAVAVVNVNTDPYLAFRIPYSWLSGIDASSTKAEIEAAWGTYLTGLYDSGKPLTLYYTLATPEVYDLAESAPVNVYQVADFGTERLLGDMGAKPEVVTEYLPNYVDVIRASASTTYVDTRLGQYVRQEDMPGFVPPLPTPTADGTYRYQLKAVKTAEGVTYQWELIS